MNPVEDEIESLRRAITALEGQRSVLGDAVVDTALAPLREKLAALQPDLAVEQRKLVTVLFADLIGFTAMSEHMDPEDVREIVNAYFKRWTACIEKAGGVVEKFIGDAVMAVFGLSVTREDDPENAVRAALEMRQALAELNKEMEQSWGRQLEMRVGIHTGLVMVSFLGERKGQDFVVVGDTVNQASRLQSAAPAGGILISHDTFQHVRGIFDVQMLNPIKVKGKAELIQVYQVLQAKRRSFRVQTRGVEGIETRMIGRESELKQLKEALFLAMEARKTQVVTVVGEAGIGKSRLIAEFDNWVELLPQVIRYFKGRANPAMQNLPYSLLRDLFSFRFQIYDTDPPRVVQEKIERGIGEFSFKSSGKLQASSDPDLPAETLSAETRMRAHFIGQMLGFRFENSPYSGSALQDPRIFRDRAVIYLIDYFKAVASIRPLVLLLEDMHWADDSSLEILKLLMEGLPDEPLLVVCATRPTFFERYPKWSEGKPTSKATFTLVHLAPLSQHNSQHLVKEILQKVEDVPESLSDLVVSRTEGNPFFMEEVIKMLIEEQVILKEDEHWHIDLSHLTSVRIPTTLVEVLQARLDSLSLEERVLLQRASVLGKIFWDDAIGFMEQGLEDQVKLSPRLVEVLFNLSVKEMVFSHEVSAFENTREFQFKHALLRDVTYESALKRLRRVYHTYAATWLETVTEKSRRSDEYAAMIADHFEQAADRKKACIWYQRAGIQAVKYYANAEAIRCFTRYLEITPDEDIAGRYDVLLKRARQYDVVANRQAQKQDLETLQALAEKLDAQDTLEGRPEASRRAQVCLQWWHYFDAVGDSQGSASSAQQAIDLARISGDMESEALGNLFLGATFWRQSDYPAAREHLERALSLARTIQLPQVEADCLRNLGIVMQYQGNYTEAQSNYEAALDLYNHIGAERGESMALNSLGTLLLDQGLVLEARSYLERSLELKRKIGHRRAEYVTLYNLAIVADKLGDFKQALDYLEQVLRFDTEMGDREGESDTLVALGKVAFHLGDNKRAKDCLEKALSLTRAIDNKVSECDALASLACLNHRLGNNLAAYQFSQEAFTLAREINLPVEQAYSLTYAGHALLGLGRADEARESYLNGLELARSGKNTSLFVEIQAGLTRAYLTLKRQAEAKGIVEEILTRLADISQVRAEELPGINYVSLEGMEEPFRVLLTCFQILKVTHDSRARDLLSAAQRLLREQANQLGDEALRRSFLENVPANREILAEWEADQKRK